MRRLSLRAIDFVDDPKDLTGIVAHWG